MASRRKSSCALRNSGSNVGRLILRGATNSSKNGLSRNTRYFALRKVANLAKTFAKSVCTSAVWIFALVHNTVMTRSKLPGANELFSMFEMFSDAQNFAQVVNSTSFDSAYDFSIGISWYA